MPSLTPADFLRLRAKIDADYQRRIKSLEDIWAIEHDEAPPEVVEGHDAAAGNIRGAWRQLARQIIEEMPEDEQFTVREMEMALQKKNPLLVTDRAAISGLLKSFTISGELQVADQGSGRRATIYVKNNKKA